MKLSQCLSIVFLVIAGLHAPHTASCEDFVREMQAQAMSSGVAPWGYWGANPEKYTGWSTHSNRLIPVYTYGIDLQDYSGPKSIYRDAARLEQLYGRMPDQTLNPEAGYFDQTDIYRLQRAAAAAGKKRIILMIFDGMDWQTTRAAAIYRSGNIYNEGRGAGLAFQDYRGAPSDFGYFVCSPATAGGKVDVDAQTVIDTTDKALGGYNVAHGGSNPWTPGDDPVYLIGQSRDCPHAVTDSASSATSLCAGIKTYNVAINVDTAGRQVPTVAHELQAAGYAIGVVTSVPISHATPACTYAHNVLRDDFHDLTRDLLGLRSIAHRAKPLQGVDVLLGAGWGEMADEDRKQGTNYTPGNKYIAADDLAAVDRRNGGRYEVVTRQPGIAGSAALASAAATAAAGGHRLFGFFGAMSGHLPYATADGQYDPAIGVRRLAEVYSESDRAENPTLADMAGAALQVLSTNEKGFWLMIEAGDVDWANHDNNLDNSIGAVLSGDAAFAAVVQWIEKHGGWDDTAMIVTADHGHYLHLTDPAKLLDSQRASAGGR